MQSEAAGTPNELATRNLVPSILAQSQQIHVTPRESKALTQFTPDRGRVQETFMPSDGVYAVDEARCACPKDI